MAVKQQQRAYLRKLDSHPCGQHHISRKQHAPRHSTLTSFCCVEWIPLTADGGTVPHQGTCWARKACVSLHGLQTRATLLQQQKSCQMCQPVRGQHGWKMCVSSNFVLLDPDERVNQSSDLAQLAVQCSTDRCAMAGKTAANLVNVDPDATEVSCSRSRACRHKHVAAYCRHHVCCQGIFLETVTVFDRKNE